MIIGIYDDHDFGWNNGDKREPHKSVYKNMFLDAVGESPTSPRRGLDKGAWHKYSLNEKFPSMKVDVFLLDEVISIVYEILEIIIVVIVTIMTEI